MLKKPEEIHNKATVIDCLQSHIQGKHVSRQDLHDYFGLLLDSGLTAVHVTVPSVEIDEFSAAIDKITVWHETINEFDDQILLATGAEDIERAKEENKVAILMGLQDPMPIGLSLSRLTVLDKLGVRIIQLSYQRQGYLATGSGERTDSGLSLLGVEAIKKMNELGMLIDLSHTGETSALEAIEKSEMPVAFTHSNPKALVNVPRNKSNEVIKALAKKGGVMGLVPFSAFGEREKGVRPTLEDYLDFIEYVVNLVGINHVGIGSDYTPHWLAKQYEARKPNPGIGSGYPFEQRSFEGMNDVTCFPNITRDLVNRGYSGEEVKKVLGGNWLALFRKVFRR